MKISIIVAIDQKRGIGRGNKLMWNIPEDLQRFKKITSGHTIIMGRKTFESIGRPLPNRTNIIVTRDPNYKVEGAVTAHSLDEALKVAQNVILSETKDPDSSPSAQNDNAGKEVFIIGGGQIFEQSINIVDKLYLTIIEARLDSPPESPARRGDFRADTFFPDYSEFKKVVFEKEGKSGNYKYKFLELER